MLMVEEFLPKVRVAKRNYQKESILTADRFQEPIEDWEIEVFKYKTTTEQRGDLENLDEILFELAKKFQRTFNAMKWWYSLMYNSNKYGNNTKARALIERFSYFRK